MNIKITNITPFIFIIMAWVITYYQGIVTAVDVWSVSEIFTHCFLVIPGACYLIFKKYNEVTSSPFKPNYWLAAPLFGTLILYTFGYVGDIKLFMHVATFTALPLLIWMVIGNQASKKIMFPLFFMLFAIPIGEQLIPYLQELTTSLAVPLIELSGVPVYRNGLYLDIPGGRFLVAEACSGISFLIASIVFGHLYAYLSFKALSKQIFFVLISITLPIIANAIRVYGIVLIAHLTDMEYAVGADHLIYGGVFYTIILFLLIFFGEKIRDKDLNLIVSEKVKTTLSNTQTKLWSVHSVIFIMFIMQIIWLANIENKTKHTIVNQDLIELSQLPYAIQYKKLEQWQPKFTLANNTQQGIVFIDKNTPIDFFVVQYESGQGELISSVNKLYDAQRWSLLGIDTVKVNALNKYIKITKLVSPVGEQRIIFYWYQVADKHFTSEVKVKLYQTANALLGNHESSALIAFSVQKDLEQNDVLNIVQKIIDELNE